MRPGGLEVDVGGSQEFLSRVDQNSPETSGLSTTNRIDRIGETERFGYIVSPRNSFLILQVTSNSLES